MEIECPYCEHEFDLCHDDGAYYDQNEREEVECPECEKRFMVRSSITWDFEGEKADCLNGEPHKWEKRYSLKVFPQFSNMEICHECGNTQTIK
jgi:DNA-directed RNA polymerase subunit RPC12/RpoP